MRFGEVFSKKASAIFRGENASEAPRRLSKRPNIQQVDFQEISWLCALDKDGSTEIMYLSNITSLQVLGPVLIPDLASRAVQTLQSEDFSLGDCSDCRDVGMPPIMQGDWLLLRGLGEVYLDEGPRRPESELSEGEDE